ncbi:hypothetical protein DVS77_18850 [Mycolicibacterium moriokaense]|nr:hypothetical protein DVS77_18850 [Mycolicibacterium moriokaense]
MADATRFRHENAAIAARAGWKVTTQAESDQFTRDGVTIEVVMSKKDFIRHLIRHGPNNEYLKIPHQTTGKVDLLRRWLTGRRSDVISPSIKKAAGVDW